MLLSVEIDAFPPIIIIIKSLDVAKFDFIIGFKKKSLIDYCLVNYLKTTTYILRIDENKIISK